MRVFVTEVFQKNILSLIELLVINVENRVIRERKQEFNYLFFKERKLSAKKKRKKRK